MFYINKNVLIVLLVLNHSYNIVLKLNKTSALSGGSGENYSIKIGIFCNWNCSWNRIDCIILICMIYN